MPTSSSSCSYSVPSAHENSVCCVSALPAGGNALSATTILILAGQLHGGSANSITAEDDETDALDRTATLPITTLQPQAATPSHQFRHSPKVKTRRSHRLSNVRFRSAHASASDCARRQTCSRRSDQSQEYVSGATSVRAHR